MVDRNKIIYLSGKYTSPSREMVSHNIALHRKYAIRIWEMGYTVISPVLNTAHFEDDCHSTYDDILMGDLIILRRCDAIYMVQGWETSKGAMIELQEAIKQKIEVFSNLEALAQWNPENH